MAEAGLISARHEPGSRRTAIRTRYVTLREANAVLGDRIDVGRGDVVVALEAELGPTDVVAQNHENVRLRVSRIGRRCHRHCADCYCRDGHKPIDRLDTHDQCSLLICELTPLSLNRSYHNVPMDDTSGARFRMRVSCAFT